jgi:hypothetical protein
MDRLVQLVDRYGIGKISGIWPETAPMTGKFARFQAILRFGAAVPGVDCFAVGDPPGL